MSAYESLKKIWKKLGLKAHVKNFSSKPLWVLDTENGKTVAHLLKPMTKSPVESDSVAMTCRHEIDNARPVFPKDGTPFVRTRRDQEFLNNLTAKGLA